MRLQQETIIYINIDTLNFCRVLTNYFCYTYIHNSNNVNNNHYNSKPNNRYIAFIKCFLGSFAAVDGKIALSRQYFDEAVQLATDLKKNGIFCGRDTGGIFFIYARVLSHYFRNWDKADTMYKEAIKQWPDRSAFHCKYGKELVYQNKLDSARYHFDMALKYSPNKFATEKVQGLLRQVAPYFSTNNHGNNKNVNLKILIMLHVKKKILKRSRMMIGKAITTTMVQM